MVIKSCQQPSPSLVLFLICQCSYQALYSYVPQNDDELELRDGDIVDVMEKCDDGWFVGKNPPFFFPSGVWREGLEMVGHAKSSPLCSESNLSAPAGMLGLLFSEQCDCY